LRDLELAKQVIREPRGRKRVEYRLNPESPLVKPLLEAAKTLRMIDEVIFESQEQLAQDSLRRLRVSRNRRATKRIVRGLVFTHASAIAAAFATFAFQDYSQHPLIKKSLLERFSKVYAIHRPVIVQLHRLDAPVANEALEKWQDEVAAMLERLLKVLYARRRAKHGHNVAPEITVKSAEKILGVSQPSEQRKHETNRIQASDSTSHQESREIAGIVLDWNR
jgi:pantothenate synthetase